MDRPTLEWSREPGVVRLAPPPDLVVAATAVTFDGAILRLFVTRPPPPRPRGRTNRQHRAALQALDAAPSVAVLVVAAEGSAPEATPLLGMMPRFPRIELLPSGDIFVVGARCDYSATTGPEKNGSVYDRSGALVREMTLGDGITSVQVDAAGEIWVSYFDEGVFGNFGWGEGGAESQPLGSAGLARFDDRGNKLWDYDPPVGFGHMADCYALNVGPSGAWAFYYTDFPLIHLSASGKIRAWHTDLSGSNQIVTDGWRAVLFGGYRGCRDACVALRLGDGDRAAVVADVVLQLPDRVKLEDATVIGRGDTLHVVHGEEAYRFRLGALRPRSEEVAEGDLLREWRS